jgi:phosphosulfolactate phosphohydrolase-like enzyme
MFGERGKFDAALAERLVEAFVFEAVVFEAPNMEDELERPMILLSTSRTRLIAEAGTHGRAFAACLRNARAQADHLAAQGVSVHLLGADSRGKFRDEGRLCCARIARVLVERVYAPADG